MNTDTYSKLTNCALAHRLESAEKRYEKALDAVYAAALHGHEKISEITARLGATDPKVTRAGTERARLDALRDEAERRLGPQGHKFMMPTTLRNLPRTKAFRR